MPKDEQPQSNLIPIFNQRPVTDADEEVFLLYTLSPPETGQSGLGYVENSHDLLEITIDTDPKSISLPAIRTLDQAALQDSRNDAVIPSKKKGRSNPVKNKHFPKGKKSSQSNGQPGLEPKGKELKVILHQDSTSLRSAAGDTGSVVWRSSVIFSQTLLRQWTFLSTPSNRHSTFEPLISLEALKSSNVLEIGSGTGVLPSLLFNHPEFDNENEKKHKGCAWVATDQESSIQILRKNLSRMDGFKLMEKEEHKAHSDRIGSEKVKISCKELDWNKVYDLFLQNKTRMIHLLRKELFSSFSSVRKLEQEDEHSLNYPDLIISLDCIFNPSLFSSLISTLTTFCEPNHTLVLLVIELRSSEMVREFLSDWLGFDDRFGLGPRWKIKSLENQDLNEEVGEVLDESLRQRLGGMSHGYGIWLAWREL